MRIITTVSLLLLGFVVAAQKNWYWANLNQSPPLVKILSTDAQNGAGARSHSLTNVPSGAFLVITTQSEDDNGNASISSTPSLTWTKAADAQAGSSGNAEIWTATYAAGGSISITSNFGSNQQSSVAWVIIGQETTPGGATAVVTGQSAPSRSIVTTRANSILVCVTSDWGAINGSSRTYRDAATEAHYYFSSGNATGYHYYKPAADIATYTEGLSAPTGQSAGTVILEVRGPSVVMPGLHLFSMNAQNGTGSRTHSLTNVPAGALLVVTTQSADDNGNASLSSSPSLTWTKRADAQASSSGNAEIWTTTFTAGGSITITSNFGSNPQSSVAWVITGQEASPGGNTASVTGQSTPSRTITTTRANSILICVSSDWDAENGTSRAYRDAAFELHYYFSSGNTTGYHYYKLASTVTTYTEGLTAPSGQSSGTVILEVRGP